MAYAKTPGGRKKNAENQRKWYLSNKEKQKRRSAEQRAKRYPSIQVFLCQYLDTHPCVECGESDIRVLDFHHVRGKKKYELSQAASLSLSMKTVEEELAKCDILCRNCHHRHHSVTDEWYRQRYIAGTLVADPIW